MPIYEFRCLSCNECFEFLVMSREETADLRCPKCRSEEFERIMSRTVCAVSGDKSAASGPTATTRSCSGGSCTTWEIPGHSR